MKIPILLSMLVVTNILSAEQEKTKAPTATPKVSAEVEQAVKEYEQTTQALGDLLIKKGLLSPWLEKFREAQQKLDAIDTKENLGIRQSELENIQLGIENCKEMSSKDTASKDPQVQQRDTLQQQKKALIKTIVQKKNDNIQQLVTLNAQIKQLSDAINEKAFTKAKLARPKAPKTSQAYRQMKDQIDAYEEIISEVAFTNGKEFDVTDDITQFFDSSPEAQQYITTLKNMFQNRKQCMPNMAEELNNQYEYKIYIFASFYWWDQDTKNQKK